MFNLQQTSRRSISQSVLFAKTRRPIVEVSADFGIKITMENDLIFRKDFNNCSAEIFIKLIFVIRCGHKSWRINAGECNRARGGVEPRVMIRSEPSVGGSTIFWRLFYTTKPTPCSLSHFWLAMPIESEFFSHRLATSPRHVSWSAKMSTSNLVSVLLITAVFLMSFMLPRSSEMPVSVVLKFQVPSLRVGLFRRRGCRCPH